MDTVLMDYMFVVYFFSSGSSCFVPDEMYSYYNF
jgi:hypothetical protein